MGSYADSMLTAEEHVIMRQRQHWLSLILESRVAIVLWLVAIGLVLLRLFLNLQAGGASDLLVWASTATIVAGIVVVVFRYLRWRAEEYLVTNRRLVNVSGIINKRSADSSLEKINDAVLEINLLARLLDYGDLDILTAADSGIDRYRMLNHANAFKKAMLTAKHALETDSGDGVRRSVGTPQPPAGSVTDAGQNVAPPSSYAVGGDDPLRADTPEEVTQLIERLTAMRDAGHLSAEEYVTKKQELLDRL